MREREIESQRDKTSGREKWIGFTLFFSSCGCLVLFDQPLYLKLIGKKLGQGRKYKFKLAPGTPIPPSHESASVSYDASRHRFAAAVVNQLSETPFDALGWSRHQGKVSTPQAILAYILKNLQSDDEQVPVSCARVRI